MTKILSQYVQYSDQGELAAAQKRGAYEAWRQFATETGLTIHVSHFPPGTSKWNTIEHRLFSFISMNWRGGPLTTFETVVQCIAHTTTSAGLTVHADYDPRPYSTGLKAATRISPRSAYSATTFTGSGTIGSTHNLDWLLCIKA